MRIVLDLQACQGSSMHRGIGRYSLALALAIARNRGPHDVRIAVSNAFPDKVVAIREAFSTLLPAGAVRNFAIPLPTAEIDPRNAWRVQAAERIREHFLASLRPDIVHVASLFEGVADDSVTSVLHGEGRFDTAATLYDLIPLLLKEKYLVDPNVSAWYYRKLDSLKRADLLVAISAHAREEALQALDLAPEKVVNISSAADDIFVQRNLAPDARAVLLARFGLHRPFVMYTGGTEYRKNVDGLIKAYAALPAAMRRPYQLAVVCSIRPPERVRLQRLAARHGLGGDELVLTGYVSDDDLVSLYNCTELFVFPSLHEGFGLPVLEAMACGAPVIGSNTSSIPEVIARADAMFDPASVPSITAAMARVLGNPAHAQALRAHGLAQAKLFSWDASARRAIAAFEDIHARNAPSRGAVAVAGSVAPLPRLALVGPALPDAMLAALARSYDVELVPPDRPLAWFDAHAHAYDHLVYQFGTHGADAHMAGLLERHPGVVILHDFFLETGRAEVRYASHGYRALRESAGPYPCNGTVIARALGVIVPAPALLALGEQWYGPGTTRGWRVVATGAFDAGSQLHAALAAFDREGGNAARQRTLGAIAALGDKASHGDLLQVAAAMAANRPRRGLRQLLVDVTPLLQRTDAGEAERQFILDLIAATPPHWRIEPVHHDGARYRYARAFTLGLLQCTGIALEDTPVDAGGGDVLVNIDPHAAPLFPLAWEVMDVAVQQGDALGGAAAVHTLLAALVHGAATPT